LQDAQAPLEDVHNWIVETFPTVDDIVIVNSSYDVRWAEVLSMIFQSLLLPLGIVPSTFLANGLFRLQYLPQELNVAG
jgi:hypothetical protein